MTDFQDEFELKLSISPEAAERLARSRGTRPLSFGKRRKRHLVDTYFDTPGHALRRSGMAVRLRDEGGKREQTLMAPIAGSAEVPSVREWTTTVVRAEPALDAIEDRELAAAFRRKRLAHRLRPVFTAEYDRTTMRLRNSGSEIEISIDFGVIRTGVPSDNRAEIICEVGLKLVSGHMAHVLDAALRLCEKYDLDFAHRTNAERGYALVRPSLQPTSVTAGRVVLDPKMSAGEAFLTIMSASLQHLFANREPLLAGHPGSIHQTRVAMRRIRAGLRAFKRILPYHKRKAFNSEFRWFQQRMSAARDWHVFLDETVPRMEASRAASERDFARLKRIARTERKRAIEEAVQNVQGRRYTRLILQFQKWLAEVRDDAPPRLFNRHLRRFGRSACATTRREMLREHRALSRLPAEDLHSLRKRGKKARYAEEFFSSLWAERKANSYRELMEALQDRLGEAHDAVVARHILWQVAPNRLDSELARQVQDWSHERVHTLIKDANPYWRRFRRRRPFWK